MIDRAESDLPHKLCRPLLTPCLSLPPSPQQRVELLRRGLSDRAPAVRAECVKMVCDYWYVRDCGSDPLALIDLLDVEAEAETEDGQWSHEEVAERVLPELLRGGHATLEKGASLRDYLQPTDTLGGELSLRLLSVLTSSG